MTSTNPFNFLINRRQSFLTEGFFKTWEQESVANARATLDRQLAQPNISLAGKKGVLWGFAEEITNLLHLRYTAGLPIEKLRHDLDEIVAAWEAFAKVQCQFKRNEEWPAFSFDDRTEYNQFIQLLGLSILMRREELIPRIYALCRFYCHDDSVFDALIAPFIDCGDEPDEYSLYHELPYELVLAILDSDDPVEQSALMQEAVESWYGANEGLPFYDTHKDIDDEGHGGYSGYWCFELAALCYLKQINDSTFREHITYPKDLVDFARQFEPEHAASTSTQPPIPTGLTAYPGDICPETGEWYAIHLGGKKTYIEAGQTMPGPTRNPAGNLVIWYLQRQG